MKRRQFLQVSGSALGVSALAHSAAASQALRPSPQRRGAPQVVVVGAGAECASAAADCPEPSPCGSFRGIQG